MKNYRVVDLYEGITIVGEADTLEETNKMVKNWVADTDGECYVQIHKYDNELKRYELLEV